MRSYFNNIIKNLKYKYRLVVYNESTFETEYTFLLSKLNLILFMCFMLILGMVLSIIIASYTPLKYYMPGYGDSAIRKQLRELDKQTDILKSKSEANEEWIKNIRLVLKGEIPIEKTFEVISKDTTKK